MEEESLTVWCICILIIYEGHKYGLMEVSARAIPYLLSWVLGGSWTRATSAAKAYKNIRHISELHSAALLLIQTQLHYSPP